MKRGRVSRVIACLAAVAGCGAGVSRPHSKPEPMPDPVMDTFIELSEEYGHRLGARVRLCTGDYGNLYVVEGLSGFTVDQNYFDTEGTAIGQATLTDTNDVFGTPIDLRPYTCETVQESVGPYWP